MARNDMVRGEMKLGGIACTEIVSRALSPSWFAAFTPLTNPPRWPATTSAITPNPSRRNLNCGAGEFFRRARNNTNQVAAIAAAAVNPAIRCSSKIPFSFCPSSCHCHASKPVAAAGIAKAAASEKL